MMAFRRITQDDASSSNISIISSLLLLLFSSGSCWAHVNGGRETAVTIDLSSTVEQKLSKFWQASVGSGHAALGVPGAIPTTIPLAPHSSLGRMWQEQLKAVHDDTGIYGVRFHGSFDDDMGPVAVATTSGEIKYNFTQLDVLYDGIMAAGVTPIVELSFMPTAIADCDPGHCPTGMHYRGVEAHPRKWSMWYDLVHAFTTHMVQRHGLQEIIKWRFEVWNELWGMSFGNGTTGKAADSPYMALYNASWHAIKHVSPRLSVGGPATMEVLDVSTFIDSLRAWQLTGTAPDFVSTHSYPTDACNTAPDARSRLDCFTDGIIAARKQAPGHTFLMTEFNCGWRNNAIHDGESKSYAAAFMFRTVNALRMHDISALSWWTFSSIFEEGALPTNEFGPFGANSAMQTVHGVPLPIYRGFQLLADAGDEVLPVVSTSSKHVYNQSGPLTIMATRNSSTGTLHLFLSNFAPDDGRPPSWQPPNRDAEKAKQPEICYKMRPNPCTETSCYLADTDFSGGDLLPESQKFRTANASSCCLACLHYKVDKFCQAWVYTGPTHKDPNRCYLKSGAALAHRRHSAGMTAGYPNGIAPPVSTDPWYNISRTVTITIDPAPGNGAVGSHPVMLRVINSTCANPKRMWLTEMKSVTWPSEAQLARLRQASEPCEHEVAVDAVATRQNGAAAPRSRSRLGAARSVTVTLEAYAAVELVVPITA